MEPLTVTVFTDPICPFAWLAYRWLEVVEQVRPIRVEVGVMSLSVLNDGRPDLSEHYARLLAVGWPAARVAAAVEARCGRATLRTLYRELGIRHHVGGRDLDRELIDDALRAAGLDPALGDAAHTPDADATLRRLHAIAASSVGDDVGTPVLHIPVAGRSPAAIFGPVLSSVPDTDTAARTWDAVHALATTPDFFELKRTRDRALTLT